VDQQGQFDRWLAPEFSSEPLFDAGQDLARALFSEDGRFLLITTTNGMIQLWDVSQKTKLRQLTLPPDTISPLKILPGGDEVLLATMGDGQIHKLDLRTGLKTGSFAFPPTISGAATVSPDNSTFIAIGYQGEIVARDLVNNRPLNVNLDVLEANYLRFSPDQSHLAVASSLGFVRIWDTTAWQEIATVGGFLNAPHGVDFSPDGRRLLIGASMQEAVQLCETSTWATVFEFSAPGVHGSIAFSPDGNYVIWGSMNGDLYAWHAPSWEEIAAVEAND
jgi:WD40 repeat protein